VVVASSPNLTAGLTLRLFDATSGKLIAGPIKPGGKRADHIALSPDGVRFLTGSHLEKFARLWDFKTGQRLGPSLNHSDWVMAVAFSADGRRFATGCKDRIARLWDSATCLPIGEPMAHQFPVVALAFSPDGRTLLTGCADDFLTTGEARLWDATSGQSIAPPRSFGKGVRAIAFRPDGRVVAAASASLSLRGPGDGEVSVWEMTAPTVADVERLRLRFQVWTDMELLDTAIFRPLTPEVWLERQRELNDFEKSP
jgi:WD40 repeat protein